jgi:hypothetical protein
VYFAIRISAYLLSSSDNNGGVPLLEENIGHPKYRNQAKWNFLVILVEII